MFVLCRAGARNETAENSGAAHVLRICSGLSTKNASQFAITRNIQQVGASLTTTATRETITYTLEGTRTAVEKVAPFLSEVVSQQVFKPWEISENVPRLRLDLALRPLQVNSNFSVSTIVFKYLSTHLYDPTVQDFHNVKYSRNLLLRHKTQSHHGKIHIVGATRI